MPLGSARAGPPSPPAPPCHGARGRRGSREPHQDAQAADVRQGEPRSPPPSDPPGWVINDGITEFVSEPAQASVHRRSRCPLARAVPSPSEPQRITKSMQAMELAITPSHRDVARGGPRSREARIFSRCGHLRGAGELHSDRQRRPRRAACEVGDQDPRERHRWEAAAGPARSGFRAGHGQRHRRRGEHVDDCNAHHGVPQPHQPLTQLALAQRRHDRPPHDYAEQRFPTRARNGDRPRGRASRPSLRPSGLVSHPSQGAGGRSSGWRRPAEAHRGSPPREATGCPTTESTWRELSPSAGDLAEAPVRRGR